jgi:Asp-tRNA(Asn)/Glu-tRNA(Gln) amidotransferase A subunit family amidase
VVRHFSNSSTADPEVVRRFDEALEDLRAGGATVVDSVAVEIPSGSLWCRRFQWDIGNYLATLGPDAPVKSLDDILEGGRYHPTIEGRLEYFQRFADPPDADSTCVEAGENSATLRANVRTLLESLDLDALVYPSWSNPPRLIGDLNTPHGNNSPHLSPPTGFPAVTVPMGFVRDGLPVGLQIFGDAWTEPTLIEIAYAYEQATRHREPPSSTPLLKRRPPREE